MAKKRKEKNKKFIKLISSVSQKEEEQKNSIKKHKKLLFDNFINSFANSNAAS